MVRLLKYFETDDCVYLMLEHCTGGLLWDVIQPLVHQSSQTFREEITETFVRDFDTRTKSPVQKQTSIIKPSESFIHDRKISCNLSEEEAKQNCDVTQSDDEDDLMIIHQTNPNSVVIVNSDKIEHFETTDDHDDEDVGIRINCDSNIVENSQTMIDQINAKLGKNDAGVKSVLDKLDHIESKIKRHLDGNLSPVSDVPTDVSDKKQEDQILQVETKVSQESIKEEQVKSKRPPVLRKLSEILPQCSTILDNEDSGDLTEVPDKLIRTWAAQLCQVLSSLHYREIIIRDLNPSNLLLDEAGHLKLTYQCQWVSVDSCLAPAAVRGNYCAPEVVSAAIGNISDITPAADWWSFGKFKYFGGTSYYTTV